MTVYTVLVVALHKSEKVDCHPTTQVAGDLLKRYQEKFRGGAIAGTWNYLTESMNAYLSAPNPVTARWEGEEHLRDPQFQLDAFRVFRLISWPMIHFTGSIRCLY